MINELDVIDWSSMTHAYGPADEIPGWLRAMASPYAAIREDGLSHFYSAVHHQGDVYASTTASLPFLFALADDPVTPDRASIVHLLVSIGRHAVERCENVCIDGPDCTDEPEYTDGPDYAGSAVVVRERADSFAAYASDDDPLVRRAAVEGLGLFIDDAGRAAALLRDRMSAEDGVRERLPVVEAMATLALRVPDAKETATAWFGGLAGDTENDPAVRLAALVQRARCAPERIGGDLVPEAIGLLRRITFAPPRAQGREATGPGPAGSEPGSATEPGSGAEPGSGDCQCQTAPTPTPATVPAPAPAPPAAAPDVPPQIAAAFEDLARYNRVHSPATSLLRTLHEVLDFRVPERTALLTEQLGSPDPGIRHDAIRMAKDVMTSWRGDHSALLVRVAEGLDPGDPYTAAEVAETLGSLTPIAEAAREALAAYVAAQRTTYGPEVWATPNPQVRRAHQRAVMALARLGDRRALPCLLTALDKGVDTWRAVHVAGSLPEAAEELVPRLCRELGRAELPTSGHDMGTSALLSALGRLGDPAAVPVIAETVTAAARHGQWRIAAFALNALAALGPAAAPALDVVRTVTRADDPDVRVAAATALWAAEGSPDEVVPLLEDLLDSFRHHEAADALGRIGPPASRVLPRLRDMLTAGYEWTRVHAATALWDIGGPDESPVVVRTLLDAWRKNGATANHAMACLDRMGPAAAPAVPFVRAQLALARRGDWLLGVEKDEELQRVARAFLARLG
ncbi:HEAT repeat domain-containing protein [Streptomyces sp. SAS_267]|uniref:HEAT repeat domain-containing protein n=1 Tax=Streptomyces sp. SAS_267 TaxID=3412750 RepID=UPI00403CCE01